MDVSFKNHSLCFLVNRNLSNNSHCGDSKGFDNSHSVLYTLCERFGRVNPWLRLYLQRMLQVLFYHEGEKLFLRDKDIQDDGMNSDKPRMVRCPACGKKTPYDSNPFRPFCSRGCKGLDLIRWTDESYKIHKKELDDEEQGNGK